MGFYKLIFLLSDRLGGTVQAKTPPLSGRLGGASQAKTPPLSGRSGGAFPYEKTTHNRNE